MSLRSWRLLCGHYTSFVRLKSLFLYWLPLVLSLNTCYGNSIRRIFLFTCFFLVILRNLYLDLCPLIKVSFIYRFHWNNLRLMMLMEVSWSSLIRDIFNICIDWFALYNTMSLLVSKLIDRFFLKWV